MGNVPMNALCFTHWDFSREVRMMRGAPAHEAQLNDVAE